MILEVTSTISLAFAKKLSSKTICAIAFRLLWVRWSNPISTHKHLFQSQYVVKNTLQCQEHRCKPCYSGSHQIVVFSDPSHQTKNPWVIIDIFGDLPSIFHNWTHAIKFSYFLQKKVKDMCYTRWPKSVGCLSWRILLKRLKKINN